MSLLLVMKNAVSFFFALFLLFINSQISNAQLLTNVPSVPKTHPRVFIVPGDIPELKKKINQPEFFLIKNTIYTSNQPILKAFRYLIDGDQIDGFSAIQGALTELRETNAEANGRKLWNSVFKGACVYDWCYDLLTPNQKADFQNEFSRIHNAHAPFWPAKNQNDALVGHNAAGWYWNQIVAGLAIYDENPVIFDNAMRLFFKNFQEARNFYYKSHLHHQGHYMGGYYSHEVQISWLIKKITGKDIFIADQQYVPYQLLYSLRPDKQQLRRGDVSDDSGVWAKFPGALGMAAEYYDDPYLRELSDMNIYKEYNEDVVNFFTKFLFRKADAQRAPLENLPLTKYFPEPVGAEMIARTGWDLYKYNSPTAIVHMRIGQYYWGAHQHKDFGTFQIYYKGNLTGDSGLYQESSSSDYGSSHWKNYYRSTIAHNGLLIYDPNEKYSGGNKTNVKVDGGVRWPLNNDIQPDFLSDLLNPDNGYKYGEVIAHEFGPDQIKPEFSYLSGDITRGYNYPNGVNRNRAKKVTRSMVTFNTEDATYPCIFVVYDRVISTDASFKKTFLLHSIHEPSISGNKEMILREDGLNGKLVSYTLLPENPTINKIGGPGKECWVIDENFSGGSVTKKAAEAFGWRIEVSPSTPQEDDEFLHAMAVMDKGTLDPGAEKIVSENLVGAKILDRVVTFSKNGNLLTHADLTIEGEENFKVLLCDLEPGQWLVKRNGKDIFTLTAGTEGKTLYFESEPGHLELTKLSEESFDLAVKTR